MAVGDSVTIKFRKALLLGVTKGNNDKPVLRLVTRSRLRPISSSKFQTMAVSEIRNVLSMTGSVTVLLTVSLYACIFTLIWCSDRKLLTYFPRWSLSLAAL
jgi:hypothetical protein